MRDLISFVGKKPIEDHPTAREGAGEPRFVLQQGWGCSDDHQFKTRNSLVVFVLLAHRVIRGPTFCTSGYRRVQSACRGFCWERRWTFQTDEIGKISCLCDLLGRCRKYEIIHNTFAIFSQFFVDFIYGLLKNVWNLKIKFWFSDKIQSMKKATNNSPESCRKIYNNRVINNECLRVWAW